MTTDGPRRATHSTAACRVSLALLTGLVLSGPGPAASAPPTVLNVALFDWGIRLSRQDVKAGPVTFEVRNVSKTDVHELMVVRARRPASLLPYDERAQRVDEQKIRTLGEVSELGPGQSGHLTLTLKPGRYALICNEPGHYRSGMVTVLTVTP